MPASRRTLFALALSACASYRVLPPAPLGDGVQPIPVRYQKSRLAFFNSDGDDGAIARVFAQGRVAVATVAAPERGVLASGDAGRSWTFVGGPFDFREVLFAGGHLYARTATRVFHSEDQGRSWDGAAVVSSDDRLDALALGAGGLLYAAGRNQLYLSADGARTWKPLGPPLPPRPAWRARNIVPDLQRPQVLYVALRTEPEAELLPRFKALLDYSSDEALSALKLVDAHQQGAVAWGAPADGVYVSQDGGARWKKTALAIDAWLAPHDGALYAAAAEPILMAAALARRHADLASAAELQMRGGGVSGPSLRAALPYPGRDALLAGPAADALAFRSSDGGASWERVEQPSLPVALALRAAVEKGGQDAAHAAPPPAPPSRQQQNRPVDNGVRPVRASGFRLQASGKERAADGGLRPGDFAQYGGGRNTGARRPPSPTGPQGPATRAPAPDTLLAFLDPQRLVARFNGGAPVTGVEGAVAWAPGQQAWDALVSALVAESETEHEISLGPAQAPGAVFELLRAEAGSWTSGPLPAGSPQSIAAAEGAVLFVRRDGRAWRIAP